MKRLAAGEVFVWLQAADGVLPPVMRAGLEALLDPEERARAARRSGAEDRDMFVRAHALLRAVLSRHAVGRPERWRFSRGPRGKPALCAPEGRMQFNMSHATGLAAVIVASGMDVGVDVECEAPRRHLALAARFFAPSELELLRAAAAPDQPELFLALWTLKEAFLKARGDGLLFPLRDFAFVVNAEQANSVELARPPGERAGHWRFRAWRATPSHRAAVAIRAVSSTEPRVHVRWLCAEAILSGAEAADGGPLA